MATLIRFDRVLPRDAAECRVLGTLALPFERRQKTRQRAQLPSGLEIAIDVPRGTVLRGGDRLSSTADGTVIAVAAALEPVSTVTAANARNLARAAYHLGNRHVAVAVGATELRYLQDHVLDAMIRALGLEVVHEHAPFEPEAGAYSGGHSHRHADRHEHVHAHDHGHDPGHRHDHRDRDGHAHPHDARANGSARTR